MPIETALTRHLGLKTPILSAPMAGIAGRALAAADGVLCRDRGVGSSRRQAGGRRRLGRSHRKGQPVRHRARPRLAATAWTIRTLRNDFYDAYAGAPKADLSGLRQAYAAAQAAGDVRTAAVIVGEAETRLRWT